MAESVSASVAGESGGNSAYDASASKKKKPGKNSNSASRTAGYLGLIKIAILGKKLTKEEKAVQDVCKRQSDLEKLEIREDWRFVFGEEPPKKKKDVFTIKGVTLRQIWMEPNFLYDAIKNKNPIECYHPTNRYYLQWLPPGSAARCSARARARSAPLPLGFWLAV